MKVKGPSNSKAERDETRAQAELARLRKVKRLNGAAGAHPDQLLVQCVLCGATASRHKRGGLVAHVKPNTSSWCQGGAVPSINQLRSPKYKKRFIEPRTVSGGLPTLGKRR